MRLAIDLDSREFRTWDNQSLTSQTVKRRDNFPVNLRFFRSGVGVELSNGATGILGIKQSGTFTGEFMAAALTWKKSGRGPGTIYAFSLNMNTVNMEALFAANPSTVSLSIEIEWQYAGYRESSVALPLTVANDYVVGDEEAPDPGPPNLANWGNNNFRFGATGEPEFYSTDIAAWVRMTLSGNPPQPTFTVLS